MYFPLMYIIHPTLMFIESLKSMNIVVAVRGEHTEDDTHSKCISNLHFRSVE